MADLSALDDLLERAGNVFSLAGRLGRAFHEEGQSRVIFYDPAVWQRHAPTFNEFWEALLELRDAMQHPPDGFAAVAERLREAVRIAGEIRVNIKSDSQLELEAASWDGRLLGTAFGIANPGPPAFTCYWEYFPDLMTVSAVGYQAIQQVREARLLAVQFAFVDEAADGDAATTPLTQLDKFAELKATAEQRAKERQDAAERSRRETLKRDNLEIAWQKIYVPSPAAGEAVNYEQWADNIIAFVKAAKKAGAADAFLAVQTVTDDERDALSLIRAGLAGGVIAVQARLVELDIEADNRGWKSVFNLNNLFWRAIEPRRAAAKADEKYATGGDTTESGGVVANESIAKLPNTPLGYVAAMPPLIGHIKPPPSWLPAKWESANWPMIDDPEAMRQWLRYVADNWRTLAKPERHKFAIPGFDIPDTRDAFRLVRYLFDSGRGTNPPMEPQRRFVSPTEANDAADVLDMVELWIAALPAAATLAAGPPKKPKRSTERGEGRAKLIAALTKHHQYANGGCLIQESIGNNALAEAAEVSISTASDFFNKEFRGHTKYRAMCGDVTRLVSALKLLNQEYSPHILFGRKPPGEEQPRDEE